MTALGGASERDSAHLLVYLRATFPFCGTCYSSLNTCKGDVLQVEVAIMDFERLQTRKID